MYRIIVCLALALAATAAAQTAPRNGLGIPAHLPPPTLSVSRHALPDISGPTWSPHFPAYADYDLFPYRFYHTSVYDPGSNTMMVFGGADPYNNLQNNVFLLTGANLNAGVTGGEWSDLQPAPYPAPPPRDQHTAVYDSANNRMIVFGGCADIQCYAPLNDTWVLTNANGVGGTAAWIQLSPTGPLPSPRYSHQAVYDAASNRMIVFGGSNLFDVWALTNANGLGGAPAWIQLTPSGGPPESMFGASAVYDPANNIATLFGGWCVNSVWTLSHANGIGGAPAWTNLVANGTAGSPGCRAWHTAVYDPAGNRMMVYGGNSDLGTDNPDYDFVAYADVWVLANANGLGGSPTWTQLHPKGYLPVGRIAHSAFYDPATNCMGIFAGAGIEGNFVSAWVLYHANGL